jgi:ABC-type nitrate/sulfonate/bicarbonate transport system ATPase subunit
MHRLERVVVSGDELVTGPPAAILCVAGVWHSYSLGRHVMPVLQDVSFCLQRGRFVAMVGPSGCGKSTLLALVAGLEEPTQGTIMLEGSTKRLGQVGYMPQRDLLHPWLNTLGNASAGLEARGTPRAAAREAAAALLVQFGLGGFEQAQPHQLSGGMRQRVALARTILASGALVLLDEPFGALDALTRVRMQQWLVDTWPTLGRTGLMVTHDVDEALLLADEVFVLSPRPGRLLARVRVPFDEPRNSSVLGTPAFAALKLQLLSYLGGAEVVV